MMGTTMVMPPMANRVFTTGRLKISVARVDPSASVATASSLRPYCRRQPPEGVPWQRDDAHRGVAGAVVPPRLYSRCSWASVE